MIEKRRERSGPEPAGSNALRSLRRFPLLLLIIYGIALGINYAWEMLQMPFYEGMYFSDPQAYLMCLVASFGDANLAIAILGLGSLLFRDWLWPFKLNIVKLIYLLVAGGSVAFVIELFALQAGRWRYSTIMPLFPLLKVGWIPILQLIILPYLSYLLAGKIRYFRTAITNDS